MDDRPFAIPLDPHRDGFHVAATRGCPVAGRVINMAGPQAMRTVIEVVRAERAGIDRPTAVLAHELAVASAIAS